MRNRYAFTLVELMVVVAIIVALLAMLAPAMRHAIEAGYRVRCAANLHQWGIVCINFASDSVGQYPTATVWGGQTTPMMIVERGGGGYSAGTDYRVLRDGYGLAEQITRCPSSLIMDKFSPTLASIGYQWNRSRTAMKQAYNASTDEGDQFRHEDYSFVANANNYVGTGRHPVATRASANKLAASVFAVDQFNFNTSSQIGYTCHESNGPNGITPSSQNLSLADGSVAVNSSGDYDRAALFANPSAARSLQIGATLFYFWEGTP